MFLGIADTSECLGASLFCVSGILHTFVVICAIDSVWTECLNVSRKLRDMSCISALPGLGMVECSSVFSCAYLTALVGLPMYVHVST